ncbi:MAG: hypothetical protein ACKO23_01595, partial [Gemmataceae bacterium]
PRLLLIDETLDTMDPDRRDHIVHSIFDPQAPWTLLIVTRDPEIISRCDRILNLGAPSTDRNNFPIERSC